MKLEKEKTPKLKKVFKKRCLSIAEFKTFWRIRRKNTQFLLRNSILINLSQNGVFNKMPKTH